MRIIAGSAKGRRLGRVPRGVRPVSDRAREGVFSSLGARVVDARCADLFAGTGAMGIEALSRGAASCVFVDSSSDAIRAIRDNLSRAGLADGARVERDEVARFVRRDPGEVDLAFLDPPYTFPEPDLRDILDHLTPHLVTGATVVLTRPRRAATDVIPVNLQVGKHLDYGDARILVLEVP